MKCAWKLLEPIRNTWDKRKGESRRKYFSCVRSVRVVDCDRNVKESERSGIYVQWRNNKERGGAKRDTKEFSNY